MLLEKLQNELKGEKINYKCAIREKREWQARKRHYIKLDIYRGNDKKRIESYLKEASNDINTHRGRALYLYNKIKMIKRLIGGGVIKSDTTNVVKIPLTIDQDYDQANEILDSGHVTSGYDASEYYNDRVKNEFVGTYHIKIERYEDYEKFIDVLLDDATLNNIGIDFSISFEEWKSGYIQDGKRQTKVNKFLRKKGFSQYVLDFYSQQIKTEKTLYITVSDRVQHIAGMAYYSTGDWDGINGSSCQDPRNEYDECIRLLGSLHDDKLLVTFLHESPDDLEDMDEKMLARSVGRIIHVNGKQFLITTRHYGNNETKNMLEKGLKQLNNYGIYTKQQMKNGNYYHREEANGCVYITETDEINIRETIDECIDVDCPMCSGTGTYTVYDSRDNRHDVTCPACQGDGTIATFVYIDIDEYIDVVTEEEVTPYAEGYRHDDHYITIRIDTKALGIDE